MDSSTSRRTGRIYPLLTRSIPVCTPSWIHREKIRSQIANAYRRSRFYGELDGRVSARYRWFRAQYDRLAMLSPQARNLAFRILVCYACVFPAATKIAAQTEADCEHSPGARNFEKEERAEKAKLTDMNGTGTDQKLKAELLTMRKVDQDARARMFASAGAEHAVIPELQKN
jgi:hypothetical protein